MTKIDPAFYADLEYRGIVKQVTDERLKDVMASESIILYCGFDPTSDSLTIGNFLPFSVLIRFQRAGHRPIIVVGGATGMIGDPGGKSSERNLLDPEQLKKNLAGQRKIFEKYFDFTGPNAAIMVDNSEWFSSMSMIDYLRDVGKFFTVNYMIAKESVRARLEDREHGISYTEFSYMTLQAYDFHYLNKKYGCRLQIGATDQWGNITAGTDLIRKIRAKATHDSGHDAGHSSDAKLEEAKHDEIKDATFGLTMPLVTKRDGTKFGKSEKGALWMTRDRTSPYQLYQFFIQSADDEVIQYLKFFTFLSRSEIDALEHSLKTAPEKREAQIALASAIVKFLHGDEALHSAQVATRALFGEEVRELKKSGLEDVFQDAPSKTIERERLTTGVSLIDLLVESGLSASKGAARKDLESGGIYLNNVRVSNIQHALQTTDLIDDFGVVLRKGKKNYCLIRVT